MLETLGLVSVCFMALILLGFLTGVVTVSIHKENNE